MRCEHCGAENRDDARFCRQCGRSLVQEGGSKTTRSRLILLLIVITLFVAVVTGAASLGSSRGERSALQADNEAQERDGVLDAAATLESIASANGSELPEMMLHEDGSLSFVQGAITSRTVNSEEEALNSIGEIVGMLNVSDVGAELRLEGRGEISGTTIYRFGQVHEGIPVLGQFVALGVDGEGNVLALSAATVDVGRPVTDPNVGVSEAVEIAKDESQENLVACLGLVYYPTADGVELAWEVGFETEMLYISAVNGTVLAAIDSAWDISGADAAQDAERSATFSSRAASDGGFELVDEGRNVTYHDAMSTTVKPRVVYKDDSGNELYRREGNKLYDVLAGRKVDLDDFLEGLSFHRGRNCNLCYTDSAGRNIQIEASCYSSRFRDGIPIYTDSDNKWDERTLDAIAGINKAYDYYAGLGWRGLGSHNHSLHVYMFDRGGLFASESSGAYMSLWGYMSIGVDNDADPEVIAHEYTHSVLNSIALLGHEAGAGDQAQALQEAYADILSLVINRDQSWSIWNGVRDLRNPADSTEYGKHLSYFSEGSLVGDEHGNCTIIGRAAYLMFDGGLSWEELGNIWYGSIWYLSPSADFAACRFAVIAAARAVGLPERKLQVIRDAFDAVGVFDGSITPLHPEAKIYVYDADGSTHNGFDISIAGLPSSYSEESCSLLTNGNRVALEDVIGADLLERLAKGSSATQLTLIVTDSHADGSGASVKKPIVISRAGLVRFDMMLPDMDDNEVSGKTLDGTYILSGRVRVHEEDFGGQRTDNVVSIVLDEDVPYEYEYKGTVQAVAHEVLLATTGSEAFGASRFDEWAKYDEQRITVECDGLQGAYHDASYWKVDTIATGKIRLLSSSSQSISDTSDSEDEYTIHFTGANLVLPEALRGRLDPTVTNNGFHDQVEYAGCGWFLSWSTDTTWVDEWRASGEPSDYADVSSETLPDGTQLIFGYGNDLVCQVEIIDPEGNRGVLVTSGFEKDFCVNDFGMNEDEVTACRELQDAVTGGSADDNSVDNAFAFLRECAKGLTFTDG